MAGLSDHEFFYRSSWATALSFLIYSFWAILCVWVFWIYAVHLKQLSPPATSLFCSHLVYYVSHSNSNQRAFDMLFIQSCDILPSALWFCSSWEKLLCQFGLVPLVSKLAYASFFTSPQNDTEAWQFFMQNCLGPQRSPSSSRDILSRPLSIDILLSSRNIFTVLCTVHIERYKS